MIDASQTFDLNNVYQIQIPVNGKLEYVERIRNEQGKILWQVHRSNIKFRDNVPVTVAYDINIDITGDYKYMYLIPVGDVPRWNNNVSGFSSKCWMYTPIAIDWKQNTYFELNLKITTGNNVNARQELFSMTSTESIELEVLGGKLHWEKTGTYGKTVLKPNTTYWVKFIKNNTQLVIKLSTDGVNYVDDIVTTAAFTVTGELMHFGVDKVCGQPIPIEFFLGSIDLNQSTMTYNGTTYQLRVLDGNYVSLVRDGAIVVQNTADDQIISGFSTKSYAHTPFYINWSTTNETTIVLNITTGADIITRQELFGMRTVEGFELEIQNNQLKWQLTNTWSKNQLQPNTDYKVVFKKVKTKYEIATYTKDGACVAYLTATSSKKCRDQYLYLGIDREDNGKQPFKGKIHCKDSYIIFNNKTYKFRI